MLPMLIFREGVVLYIWDWRYILHKSEVLKTEKEIFRHVSALTSVYVMYYPYVLFVLKHLSTAGILVINNLHI